MRISAESGAFSTTTKNNLSSYGLDNVPTKNNLSSYGLDNVDCDICQNRGYILFDDAERGLTARECTCMASRRSLRRIKNSNMEDALSRYSFDTYEETDKETHMVKKKALEFAENPAWFFIGGRSGSGKTHICTAICGELIRKGYDVRYELWRDLTTTLKPIVNDPEYAEKLKRLSAVPVLYIDDLFKGNVTGADLNLAFQLINARYNDRRLITILSSELTLSEIIEHDEALGGRIYERARGFVLAAPNRNRRIS